MDLSTRYLGFKLPHPFVCGASPLSADLDTILRLEDSGAAAIVMHSLFEEQILADAKRRPHLMAVSTRVQASPAPPLSAYALSPGEYLEHLLRVKQRVRVPIIASLNGTTAEGWLQYARALERAGADALELNFYFIATDPAEDALSVEQRVLDVVAVVKESVTIPVAVKLSPFYSSLPNVATRLDRIGADGLVLFNRFYQADIDVTTRGTHLHLRLSDSSDLLLRVHAMAILSGRTRLSLALSGGVHEAVDAVKSVMAGAHVVQVVSALLRHGPSRLGHLRKRFEAWMDDNHYESVEKMRGIASIASRGDAARFERGTYVGVLQSWMQDHPPAGD
jgi:dihydroorotate dehydrogenase (fumarate)